MVSKCFVAATILGALLVGCAGPVPVSPNTAGAAVDTTQDLFRAGKAETHQPVSLEQSIAAARAAAQELDLKLIREEPHPDQIKLIYRDSRKLNITVTLVSRTTRATQMRVDVGLFGDAGMGELVLWQIVRGLPEQKPLAPAALRD
jgi:hypothetical protein